MNRIIQHKLNESFNKFKESIAIEYGSKFVTYAELDRITNYIANWIVNKGIKKETFMGIYIDDRAAFISAIIGVLKAGCVFVPLDSAHPQNRLEIMINATDIEFIITDKSNSMKFVSNDIPKKQKVEIVVMDDLFFSEESLWLNQKFDVYWSPEDKIYIYFTSGTTGKPKAILGKNKSLLHFVDWEISTFNIEKTFRFSQFITPGFDVFLRDIFVPLCAGGTICIPESKEFFLTGNQLVRWIDSRGITLIHCVPSLFRLFNTNASGSGNFKNLKYVLLAGERVNPVDIERWYETFDQRIQLVNMYGPTETTLAKIFYLIQKTDVDKGIIPIGRPISGARVIIMDENMNLCDELEVGELYIRTPFRTFGYHNDAELNKRKFIQNPFGNNPDDIIYKTGDLGRLLPDGNIELLGRIDRQVKIRGMRIELEEIESVFTKYPPVKEAVVIKREISNENPALFAFITTNEANKAEEVLLIENLKKYLVENLPDYMVPVYIKRIESIPRKPNLKVDFDALSELLQSEQKQYKPPSSDIEKKLADIWSEVLGIEKIGVTDSFLELGGNSLNIMSLVSKIHREFDVRIPLAEMFNRPFIEKLAVFIGKSIKAEYAPIEPVEMKGYYPLSPAQKRLYVIQHMQLDSTNYNIPAASVLEGELNKEKFEYGFRKLIDRHESLRTSFEMIDGEPVQRIHAEVDFEIEYDHSLVNCQARGEVPSPIKVEKIIRNFVRPFDLPRAPLLRVGLIKVEERKHIFLFDLHHIITDGTSQELLAKEFMVLYAGRELPLLRVRYKDYLKWLNCDKQREAITQQEKYWLKEFEGKIPEMNLPTDFLRPAVQSFDGDSLDFEITGEDTSRLKAFALEEKTTLYMALLAIYNVFLSKLANMEDIIVGTPVSGRSHPDLEPIVGMFVNNLVLRNDVSGDRTFKGFLKEEKERTLEALKNQDYQYENLVEKVEVSRNVSRNPLFDVVFVFHNMDISEVEITGLKLKPYRYKKNESKFDLTLQGWESKADGNLVFNFEYCTKLFKKETIERFILYFKKILSSAAKKPEEKISDIEIITGEEKKQVLLYFNDTRADYPKDKTIHELFAKQVERAPDNTALVGGWMHLSYQELNERADQLALLLREKGLKPDTIVGIMVESSLEMIIDLMGILKAGGAYLPIDPEYPEERINYMLADSSANLLLTNPHLSSELERLSIVNCQLLMVNEESTARRRLNNPPKEANSINNYQLTINNLQLKGNNLAYIIYTSGTTGRPKGTLIEHRNVVRLMVNDRFQFDFSPHDIWTMFHSYCFDFSVWEMYGALLYGGKLIVIPKTDARDTVRYLEILKKQVVTVLNQTPSAFYNLMELELQETAKELQTRYVIFGGEALSPGRLKKWKAKYPGTRLINMYGITETTVHVTFKEIEDSEIEENISNIGRPIPTLSTYVMDRHLNLQPIGIAGELYVGGEGLGRGYLNRPGLTAEKFKRAVISHSSLVTGSSKSSTNDHSSKLSPNDQWPMTNDRFYKTGDLARWLSNGELEYLGRIDQQVKIRGYRIELGEIENKLLRHEDITESIVLVKEDRGKDKYLCAYIVSNNELKVTQLRGYLQEELPGYMIPAYFVKLDEMPLTPNGKIDRDALPEPAGIGLGIDVEYVAPRNDIEEKLVEVWKQVLGRDIIGIKDNFFEIGGDSIKTIQIASRMNKAGFKLEMKDIFLNPQISGLAPLVKKIRRIADQSPITGTLLLTPIQKWFFESKSADKHHFNQAVMLYSQTGFEEGAVKKVFSKIQEHHDALRMTFKEFNGRIIQENHGLDHPLSLDVFDLRNRENAIKALEMAANEIQVGINLEKGPLMKLGLFHLDDGDRLLIVIHHLVIDGVSWRILFEDIETLYRQYNNKESFKLPLKTDSYRLWSEKLSGYANSDMFLKEKAYWAELESKPKEVIKKDFPDENNYLKDVDTISFNLNEKETRLLLTEVNEGFGTEINDILVTALGLAIKRSYGNEQLLIAMEGHGREEILKDVDMSRTVGWFTSLYPVQLDFSYESAETGDRNLSRQIKEVKERLRHMPHKGIGYGILKYLTAEEHKKEIDFKLKPQICFNYLGQFGADLEQMSFPIARESAGSSTSPAGRGEFELGITGIIVDKQLVMSVNYNKKQYKRRTIQSLWNGYRWALSRIILYCSEQKEKVLTPSDLTYPGLSIETLDRLQGQYSLEDIYPLTPMQKGILFHTLYDSSSSYLVQMSYRLHGKLDAALVKKSLNELMKRYDILRAVVISEGLIRPIQLILKAREVEFCFQDIRKIIPGDEGDKEAFIKEFKEKDRQRSFDLSKDVLLRVALLQVDESEYELTWCNHHILMDGWCTANLIAEFIEIYYIFLGKREYRLPPVTSYKTYIQWLGKQDKEKAKKYWQNFLEGYEEAVRFPKRNSTGLDNEKYKKEELPFTLGIEKTSALDEVAARNKVTLSIIIQAIWGILLAKYNDKKDVVFGLVVSGRPSEIESVESIVGLFINTIPVRMRFQGNTTFTELVRELRRGAINSEPYHYCSLAEIQAGSTIKQDLLDHFLTFLNYPVEKIERAVNRSNDNKSIDFEISGTGSIERSNYDLDVIITLKKEILIKLKYNRNIFYSNLMNKIPGHIQNIVDQVIENNEIKIEDIVLSYDSYTADTGILQDNQCDFEF